MQQYFVFAHDATITPQAIFDVCRSVWVEALWEDSTQRGKFEDRVYNPDAPRFCVWDRYRCSAVAFSLTNGRTAVMPKHFLITEGVQKVLDALKAEFNWTLEPQL